MPAWPVTVPSAPLIGTLQITPEDNLIRFKPDNGPAQTRRRYTSKQRNYAFELLMSSAQLATFETFVATDIADGALSFTFPDPVDNVTRDFRMEAPHQIAGVEAIGYWRIGLTLSRMS